MANFQGELVAGLTVDAGSTAVLARGAGLTLDAHGHAFGAALHVTGAFQATGDFTLDATADRIALGGLDIDLVGTVARLSGVIDYRLVANFQGELVAGLTVEAGSTAVLARGMGLTLDAHARAFGAAVHITGAFQASGDFTLNATAETFTLGGLHADLVGSLSRAAGVVDYHLVASIAG